MWVVRPLPLLVESRDVEPHDDEHDPNNNLCCWHQKGRRGGVCPGRALASPGLQNQRITLLPSASPRSAVAGRRRPSRTTRHRLGPRIDGASDSLAAANHHPHAHIRLACREPPCTFEFLLLLSCRRREPCRLPSLQEPADQMPDAEMHLAEEEKKVKKGAHAGRLGQRQLLLIQDHVLYYHSIQLVP